MNFLDKVKYTLNYPHVKKISLLNFRRKKVIESKELLNICKDYTRIVALASGPSLNLCSLNKETLYITTNSSYLYLNNDFSFIHIIKDINYLKKFLLFGLKYKPLLVIIDVFTHTNGQGMGSRSLKILNKDFGKKVFEYPVVITNNEKLFKTNFKDYYNMRIDFMNRNNLKNPASNSGLMIYEYMIWLTNISKNIKTCKIYGLDAGEGGKTYFNGLKTLPNHVAMRDNNKEKMGKFLDKCQEKFPIIKNYSYFKNNVDTKS